VVMRRGRVDMGGLARAVPLRAVVTGRTLPVRGIAQNRLRGSIAGETRWCLTSADSVGLVGYKAAQRSHRSNTARQADDRWQSCSRSGE